jgi:hypothetical protein
MDLHEQLELVNDEESFLAFARELRRDRIAVAALQQTALPIGSSPGGWESSSIESFLEAAIAWAEDSSFGARQGLSASNPWRKFAVFLYCGKVYE